MSRLPGQCKPVDHQQLFWQPRSPCTGIPYEGASDFERLIGRGLDGPLFCGLPATAFGGIAIWPGRV